MIDKQSFKLNATRFERDSSKKAGLIPIALVIVALVVAHSDAQQVAEPVKLQPRVAEQFLARYADKLEARLKDRSVGYSFTVVGGDTKTMISRSGGDARRAPDANPRKMSPDDKFNVASVSKTITAAAVMKILNEKKLSVDLPVAGYLPPSWTLGSNFDKVTLRELLTHRSGIRCPKEVTYKNLKECVAAGVTSEDKAVQKYNNSNYALFRFIIPNLNGFPAERTKIDESKLSAIYSKLYAEYVERNIFAPIGLRGIDLKPIASDPALAYQFPEPLIGGESFGDMTETSASRGWHLSSLELAIFLHYLLHTEKIVPKSVSRRMVDEGLGLWKVPVVGDIVDYEHGGHYPGKDSNGKVWNKGEMNTLIASFSNGVDVAIIVNSQFSDGSIAKAAREAMKEAIK